MRILMRTGLPEQTEHCGREGHGEVRLAAPCRSDRFSPRSMQGDPVSPGSIAFGPHRPQIGLRPAQHRPSTRLRPVNSGVASDRSRIDPRWIGGLGRVGPEPGLIGPNARVSSALSAGRGRARERARDPRPIGLNCDRISASLSLSFSFRVQCLSPLRKSPPRPPQPCLGAGGPLAPAPRELAGKRRGVDVEDGHRCEMGLRGPASGHGFGRTPVPPAWRDDTHPALEFPSLASAENL